MIFKLQDIQSSIPYSVVDEAPSGWKELLTLPTGRAFRKKISTLTVLSSLDRMNDGSLVLHVSVSRRNQLPTWEDLKTVKNIFMGLEVEAYHIIPAASDHVNLHNYCMHLWRPVEEKLCQKN